MKSMSEREDGFGSLARRLLRAEGVLLQAGCVLLCLHPDCLLRLHPGRLLRLHPSRGYPCRGGDSCSTTSEPSCVVASLSRCRRRRNLRATFSAWQVAAADTMSPTDEADCVFVATVWVGVSVKTGGSQVGGPEMCV